MAKTRSPSYPSISLKEAIDKVRSIYEQNYQSPVPRAVAAELMGYGGLNGKSLGVLAALSKYGLLEGRGDDTRVSDLALAIIAHEPGTLERGQAVLSAASRPELFTEIDGRFSGGKASDASIRSWLMTQKFIPQAADAVVRSYRETKQLVAAESGVYDSDKSDAKKPVEAQSAYEKMLETPANEIEQPRVSDETPLVDPFEVMITGSKTGKRVEGRFLLRTDEEIEDFVTIINAMKRHLTKATPTTSASAQPSEQSPPGAQDS